MSDDLAGLVLVVVVSGGLAPTTSSLPRLRLRTVLNLQSGETGLMKCSTMCPLGVYVQVGVVLCVEWELGKVTNIRFSPPPSIVFRFRFLCLIFRVVRW